MINELLNSSVSAAPDDVLSPLAADVHPLTQTFLTRSSSFAPSSLRSSSFRTCRNTRRWIPFKDGRLTMCLSLPPLFGLDLLHENGPIPAPAQTIFHFQLQAFPSARRENFLSRRVNLLKGLFHFTSSFFSEAVVDSPEVKQTVAEFTITDYECLAIVGPLSAQISGHSSRYVSF